MRARRRAMLTSAPRSASSSSLQKTIPIVSVPNSKTMHRDLPAITCVSFPSLDRLLPITNGYPDGIGPGVAGAADHVDCHSSAASAVTGLMCGAQLYQRFDEVSTMIAETLQSP